MPPKNRLLRIKMKGRETVFEREIPEKSFKEVVMEHLVHFSRETVRVGTDRTGRPIMAARDVPKDIWEFYWVENPGEETETEEPITIG